MALLTMDVKELMTKFKFGLFFAALSLVVGWVLIWILGILGAVFSTNVMDWLSLAMTGKITLWIILFAVFWIYLTGWMIGVVSGEEKISDII